MSSEIEDRRQRARIAYYDSAAANRVSEGSAVALEEAIEVATQVKITDEAIKAAVRPVLAFVTDAEMRAILRSALPALGFEVIE